MISLRDDRHHLNDPKGLLSGTYDANQSVEDDARPSAWTLYRDGFRGERFIEVIERREPPHSDPAPADSLVPSAGAGGKGSDAARRRAMSRSTSSAGLQ